MQTCCHCPIEKQEVSLNQNQTLFVLLPDDQKVTMVTHQDYVTINFWATDGACMQTFSIARKSLKPKTNASSI